MTPDLIFLAAFLSLLLLIAALVLRGQIRTYRRPEADSLIPVHSATTYVRVRGGAR